MLTSEQLKQLTNDVEAFYARLTNWADAEYFHTQALGAAAMAAELPYFNVVRAYGVTNFIKPNEVPFPFILTDVGIDMDGPPEDQLIVQEHTEVVIKKDNRAYAPIPSCHLPSGSGLSMAQAAVAAGNAQDATTGVDNRMFTLPVAIGFVPEQHFEVLLRSDATAIVTGVNVKILLRGIVGRRVI